MLGVQNNKDGSYGAGTPAPITPPATDSISLLLNSRTEFTSSLFMRKLFPKVALTQNASLRSLARRLVGNKTIVAIT